VYGCLFEDNWGSDIVGNGTYGRQITAARNKPDSNSGTFHYYMSAKSCGLVGGANQNYDTCNNSETSVFTYSVFQNGRRPEYYHPTVVKADPLFVDAANGDWRVYSCGPAAHRLDLAAVDWLWFASIDLTGQPFRFNADGTTVAGAFADVVPGVIASSDRENGVSPSAVVPVAESGTVTFTATADRPLAGWEVNGVTNLTTERTFDLAVSPTAENGDVYYAFVKPVYGNVWYVDAVNGDDDNGGYVPDAAKKTLAEILAKATENHDVVKAAPGDYNEDTMVPFSGVLRSRVTVWPGVTLESTGGADVTFITGSPDSADKDYPGSGLGTNAVRCAALWENSTLRGFTLRDGHSNGSGPERDDVYGGGVYCRATSAVVEDCIISNCCATRGGGGRYGTYVRCRFLGNRCTGNAPAARGVTCYDCYADHNRYLNSNNFGVFYSANLYKCTVGSDNRDSNGNESYAHFDNTRTDNTYGGKPYRIVNTLICSSTGSWGGLYSNCVFKTGAQAGGGSQKELFGNVNPIYGDVSLDANGVPTKTCAAVDAADESLDLRAVGATDLYGRQRVWNVRRDVGCFDYDWRGDYAAVLGHHNAAVTLAEPNVTLNANADAVKILAGVTEVTWVNPSARKPRCRFRCEVKGSGTLTVLLNGEEFATLTNADGAAALDFKNALAENQLSFSYAPGDGDSLGAEVGFFSSPIGTAAIIR